MGHDPTYNLIHTRLRADLDGLNSEASGWLFAEDADPTVDIGQILRLRCRITETAGNGSANTFKAQFNHAAAGWTDFSVHGTGTTLQCETIVSPNFADGNSITTQYLTSGGGTFVNGTGDNTNSISSSIDAEETEIEISFVINRSYDGPAFVSDGDQIEIRIVESDGTTFTGTSNTITITVNFPNKFLGGTFAETWQRQILADDNGNIYALIEVSEGDPDLQMMKSTDGGNTWAVQDHANRPTQIDMEAADMVLDGNSIYIAQQDAGHEVYHHIFNVSTHGTTPDTWATTGETVRATVALNSNPQTVSIERRSDGTTVLFYVRDNSTSDHAYYKIRTSGGSWGSEQTLDAESSYNCRGIVTAKGASDKIHIFYVMENGSLGPVYHRSLTSGDSLSARETVDSDTLVSGELCSVTNAVYWDSGGDEKIMVAYKDTDNNLKSVVVTNDGTPETAKTISDATVFGNGGGSDKVTGFLSVYGSDVYAHWADRSTQDLYRDKSTNDGGWGTDVEELDGKTIEMISSAFMSHTGGAVIGYLYDNGADGGTGLVWYGEYAVPVDTYAPLSKVRHGRRAVYIRM